MVSHPLVERLLSVDFGDHDFSLEVILLVLKKLSCISAITPHVVADFDASHLNELL